MIVNFSHGGLSRLYEWGSVTTIQMAVDRRSIAVMDVLASLHPDEPIPAWLEPACLASIPTGYCIPVSDRLFIAFTREGPDVTEVRLVSAAVEAPGPNMSCPTVLKRPLTHPGTVFRDLFMPSSGLTAVAASQLLSVPTGSLFRFCAGGRRAVGNFAQELSRLSGTSASFWTRLQSAYDRWPPSAFSGSLPIAEIVQALDAEVLPRLRQNRLDRGLIGKMRRRLLEEKARDH